MGDITAANAIISLSVPPLFPVPVQIQGFAADDIFDFPEVETVERSMGVDGILSGGWVWKEQPQRITLQADSPSCDFFDQIELAMKAGQSVLFAQGIVILPAVGRKYQMINGLLATYKPDGAARILRARGFTVAWNNVLRMPN